MSKPKCNWCVWEWHTAEYRWFLIATFHRQPECSSAKFEAALYARTRVPSMKDCYRVLPEGRTPKGRQ